MFPLQMLILTEIAAITGMFTQIICTFFLFMPRYSTSNALVHNAATARSEILSSISVKFPPRLLLLVSIGKCLSLHLFTTLWSRCLRRLVINIKVTHSTNPACSPSNNLPLGLHMENGSGGFMGGKLLRHFLGAVANLLQISSSTVGILESGLETNSMFLSYRIRFTHNLKHISLILDSLFVTSP